VISPNSFQISKNWWIQFPYHLRLITKIRFYAAFGAGGVIYLTSLIFNNIGLSATDIGLGFTISAIIGTVTRLFTGNYLNKTGEIRFSNSYFINTKYCRKLMPHFFKRYFFLHNWAIICWGGCRYILACCRIRSALFLPIDRHTKSLCSC